jgi:hypothetical protein
MIPVRKVCLVCHEPLGPRGRLFCSPAHKMRAYRRRKQGLPEWVMAKEPFHGGSISLAETMERRREHLELKLLLSLADQVRSRAV